MDLDLWHLSDTIEEDAINEKCCVEVLNRLIAKADEDIFVLEDDLAILQSQLIWTEHDEHEKLYEVWCATFRKKITSLNRSLQTSRKECAPNNHALNADFETRHGSLERIHDIIRVLLEQNIPTQSEKVKDMKMKNEGPKDVTIVAEGDGTLEDLESIKAVEPAPRLDMEREISRSTKEFMITNADLEARVKTTLSASLDSSWKPDKKQNIGTENQPMTVNINVVKDLPIRDANLTEILGFASEKGEKPLISEPDCQKVSENDIEGESFALQGAKAVKGSDAIIVHQQDCEVTGEHELLLRAPELKGIQVELNEDEPLVTLLGSQGQKRKKLEPNPEKSETEVVEESNQKLCMNAATFSLKPSSTSEDENSNRNSGPASASMNSNAREWKGGEKQGGETAASRFTKEKLEKMNRSELMAIARSQGLKGYSKLKKCLIVKNILEKFS